MVQTNTKFFRLMKTQLDYMIINTLCLIKELSREEFDRKVQENPANDHLKVRKSKQEEQTSPNEYGEFNDEVDLVEHILPNIRYLI